MAGYRGDRDLAKGVPFQIEKYVSGILIFVNFVSYKTKINE